MKRTTLLFQAVATIAIFSGLICDSATASVLTRQWCEYKTDHFTLYTDLRKKSANRLAEDLVHFHHAVTSLVGIDPMMNTTTKLVVFRNVREFTREFKQKKFIGIMHPSLREPELLLSLSTKGRKFSEVPFHEYSHYIIRSRLERPAPLWLEEGLAQYFSTLEYSDSGTARIGSMDTERILVQFIEAAERSIHRTLEFNLMHAQNHSLLIKYATSWALVHYLMHGDIDTDLDPIERLNHLLQGINNGVNALEKYFDIAKINEDDYVDKVMWHLTSEHSEIRFKYPKPTDINSSVRCLNTVEKQVLLASAIGRHNHERAQEILERLQRRFPDDHRIFVALSEIHGETPGLSLPYAEQAYELEANVASTNVAKGVALVQQCLHVTNGACEEPVSEAKKLFLRALELDPNRVDASYGLAVLYLNQGDPQEALSYLQDVHKHAPWSPRVNFHLGDALRQLGDISNATRHLSVAAYWETDNSRREITLQMLAALRYRD